MTENHINDRELYVKRSQLSSICRRFMKNKTAMVGLVIFSIMLILIIFANLYLDYDSKVVAQNISERLQGPSAAHWFGTDQYGRDEFARIIFGGRASLLTAIAVIVVSMVIGVIIGALAGYYGGIVDIVIMRINDVLYCIPFILLAICIVSSLGGGLLNLGIAATIACIPSNVRLIRSWVMPMKGQDYIEAAKACGTSDIRIFFRHILPNVLGPIIIQATLHLALTIITVAGMSYLGLGVQSPTPEWGAMLSEAKDFMRDYQYLVLFPGLAILLTTLSLNLIGDGLRDALDPKLRN